MDDKEKLALDLLKQEDKKGLKEAFELLYAPLCLYAQKFVDKLDVAEDIVQEVFIAFWENKSYLNVKSKLGAYLYRTVKNRCLNYLRDNKMEFSEWLDEYSEIYAYIEDIAEPHEEIMNKIQIAINQLPKGSRAIFTSIVIDGRSYKEAAQDHNISVNTIKSQLKRAFSLLSQKLDNLSFIILMELFFNFFKK
jgi:RNA polymerase sigma-70 factor (ECF subfamily)